MRRKSDLPVPAVSNHLHPDDVPSRTSTAAHHPDFAIDGFDQEDNHYESAAGIVLLIHAIMVVLYTVILAGMPQISRLFNASSLTGAVLGALVIQGGFILLPTLLIAVLVHVPPMDLTGTRAHPGSLILSFLIGIPAAVVFSGLNNLLLFFLSSTGFKPPVDALAAFDIQSFDRSIQEMMLIVIVSILLPAICEELMFRGLIQGSLLSRTGEGTAIFLQAFVFMLFHNNPSFLLPPFLAGLLLGLIRSRSGSIIAAIAAHLSLNGTLALISAFLPRFSMRFLNDTPQSGRSLLYASLIASCLAAVALVPLVVLIGGIPPEPNRQLPARHLPFDLKFALATLLMLATIVFAYFNS